MLAELCSIVGMHALSPTAKVLYLYLLPHNKVELSRRDIARQLGFRFENAPNLHYALEELKEVGLLEYLGTPQQGRQTPFRLLNRNAPMDFKGRKLRSLPAKLHEESPTVQASYLYLLGTSGSRTTKEVESALGVSYIGAYRALRRLLEVELIRHAEGQNPQRFMLQ